MGFWQRDLMEIYLFEDIGFNGKIILKLIFKTRDGAWSGLIWLKTAPGDWVL